MKSGITETTMEVLVHFLLDINENAFSVYVVLLDLTAIVKTVQRIRYTFSRNTQKMSPTRRALVTRMSGVQLCLLGTENYETVDQTTWLSKIFAQFTMKTTKCSSNTVKTDVSASAAAVDDPPDFTILSDSISSDFQYLKYLTYYSLCRRKWSMMRSDDPTFSCLLESIFRSVQSFLWIIFLQVVQYRRMSMLSCRDADIFLYLLKFLRFCLHHIQLCDLRSRDSYFLMFDAANGSWRLVVLLLWRTSGYDIYWTMIRFMSTSLRCPTLYPRYRSSQRLRFPTGSFHFRASDSSSRADTAEDLLTKIPESVVVRIHWRAIE